MKAIIFLLVIECYSVIPLYGQSGIESIWNASAYSSVHGDLANGIIQPGILAELPEPALVAGVYKKLGLSELDTY